MFWHISALRTVFMTVIDFELVTVTIKQTKEIEPAILKILKTHQTQTITLSSENNKLDSKVLAPISNFCLLIGCQSNRVLEALLA